MLGGFARSSSDAISSLLQLQRRNGRYVVGLCKVQVTLITVAPHCLFDTSVNSTHCADTLFSVLPNTTDIRNWNQHKAIDLHALRTSQFVSVLCGHI